MEYLFKHKKIKSQIAAKLQGLARKFGKIIIFDDPHNKLPVLKDEEYQAGNSYTIIQESISNLGKFSYAQFGSGTNLVSPYLNVDINDLSNPSKEDKNKSTGKRCARQRLKRSSCRFGRKSINKIGRK